MPANILNLPQYRVLRVQETDHDYHVTAEPVDVTAACPHCQSDRLNSWGTREQVFKDLPMHGKRVGIYIDTKRLRCQACGKTFSQTLPLLAENRMMTDRLVKWIGQQALKHTFTSLADETGVVEGTIRNIFRDYINELEQTVRFETPKWMGIDEIHIINKPRCVVSNIQNNTIVDMLHNRNKDTVAKYLFKMPNRDKVQYVAMDMWTPYRDAVTAVLPDATIVIDKFHVVSKANAAFDTVRRKIANADKGRSLGLKRAHKLFAKRKNDLNDEQYLTVSGWLNSFPELAAAYDLKERLFQVYEATAPDEAWGKYLNWESTIPPEMAKAFRPVRTAFRNWKPFILNYFDDQRVTNAFTESFNAKVRAVYRNGRGYTFERLRAKVLYTDMFQKRVRVQEKVRVRKQKFEDVAMMRFMCMGTDMDDEYETQLQTRVVNLGVDLSTLEQAFDSGKF